MVKEQLIAYLNKKHWTFLQKDDILKLDVSGNGFSWNSFFKVDQEASFCYFSVLPAVVPQERMELVSKLLHNINCRIWFGNFEIILEGSNAGQVRLRTSSFLPPDAGQDILEQLIDLTVNFNMAAMNFYGPILMKALYGDSEDPSDFIR